MLTTNEVGIIGEARIEYEAAKRGYMIAVPRSHYAQYDLIVDRKGKLERVQVKTVRSDGNVIKAGTATLKRNYTETDFEWLAVHDITTDECYFIPSNEMPTSGSRMYLRLQPTKNNQTKKIKWANDYLVW